MKLTQINNVKRLPMKQKGKNVRFTDASHKLLVAYCKEKGYNLGAFCEIGALDKMKNDSTNSLKK